MAKRGRPRLRIEQDEPVKTPIERGPYRQDIPFTPVRMQYGSTVKTVLTQAEYDYEIDRGKWTPVKE